jgi:flagellar biosynthetic protein FlhB
MSGKDEDTDKSFEATPQKLLEARRKGDVAKSNDLLTAAAYLGLLVALMTFGADSVQQFGTTLMVLIDRAPDLSVLFVTGGINAAMGGVLSKVALALLPLFLIPAVFVILAVFAQRAWVFAPSKLQPKLSRISLLENAKNKFGRGGLFEFAKSFTKLVVYSFCLTLFIRARLPEILGTVETAPHLALLLMVNLCLGFLFLVVIIATLIGGIDAVWQHFEHLRKNMMSRKEITDEAKNAEGDPHLKQERRQRAMEIAQNQMMAEVPKADVIIVNPTHFAVALKWSREKGDAPICVAKGIDEIARAIREAAATAGVPIHSDPPTARALHASTDIGQQIAPDHYQTVAAAIRFAEQMRQRARGQA